MKLLLDENLPLDLRHFLAGHDVFTVAYLGWKGFRNGALLARAFGDGFEAVLTMDSVSASNRAWPTSRWPWL